MITVALDGGLNEAGGLKPSEQRWSLRAAAGRSSAAVHPERLLDL